MCVCVLCRALVFILVVLLTSELSPEWEIHQTVSVFAMLASIEDSTSSPEAGRETHDSTH